MNATGWAAIIAAGAFVVLIAFIVPILLQVRKTIATVNDFIESTEKEIMPTLNKLQTTVEEVNQELSKVNETTASVQSAVNKVEHITKLVQEVVSSPLIKIASFSAGLQGAARSFLKGTKKK